MLYSGEGVGPEVQQLVEAVTLPAAEVGKVKPEEKEKPVKEKKPKEKRKKKETKPRQHKAVAHPPYFQMIKEAIKALKDKSGSSPYAIAKHIEAKNKPVLPANFRKILSLQLKNSTFRGKLIKIKDSYKLSQAEKKEKVATAKTPTTRAARANAGKPEEVVMKNRRSSRSMSVNQIEAAVKAKTAAAAVGRRRTMKSTPTTKPKQPNSLRSTAKKAKKMAAV